MPDMDGYEVTGMITANPATATIPVVMCTGHDTPQDRARAKESGASGFVTKPVDDSALDALLAELREARRRGRGRPPPKASPKRPRRRSSSPPPVVTAAPVVRPTGAYGQPDPVAPPAAAPHRRPRHGRPQPTRSRGSPNASRAKSRKGSCAKRWPRFRGVREGIAQRCARGRGRAAHDALASLRAESRRPRARRALGRRGRYARRPRIVQPAVEAAEAARKSAAMAADDKLREALATVHATAERVARQTVDSAKSTMEDASRKILEAARAELQDTARIAAETAAKPDRRDRGAQRRRAARPGHAGRRARGRNGDAGRSGAGRHRRRGTGHARD